MKELEIMLLIAIAAMGVLLIILLQKITILKKQADNIVEEVKAYVAYVTSDTEMEMQTEQSIDSDKLAKKQVVHTKQAISKEEAENHLIQAVLGEFFP